MGPHQRGMGANQAVPAALIGFACKDSRLRTRLIRKGGSVPPGGYRTDKRSRATSQCSEVLLTKLARVVLVGIELLATTIATAVHFHLYLIRLAALLLIIFAIWEKNKFCSRS